MSEILDNKIKMEIIDNKILICPKCNSSTIKYGLKRLVGFKCQLYRCENGHLTYKVK